MQPQISIAPRIIPDLTSANEATNRMIAEKFDDGNSQYVIAIDAMS
jgi:hypothetical protein